MSQDTGGFGEGGTGLGWEGADPCKGEWCHRKDGGMPKLAQERALQ